MKNEPALPDLDVAPDAAAPPVAEGKQRAKRRGRDGLFLRNAWCWIDYTGADGKRHRKKAAPNYQTAKLVYRDTMAKIARGEVLGVREEGIRVKEFVDRHYWPAVKATLAPVWAQRSRYILDAVLLPVFGGTKLSRLRQQDVERWYGERLSEVKPSTANKELARLKHLLGRAVKWAYLKTSPAKDVARAKEPDGRVRYLTSEEREKLLNGAHETVESKDGRRWTVHHKPGAALRPYVLAALQTGARCGIAPAHMGRRGYEAADRHLPQDKERAGSDGADDRNLARDAPDLTKAARPDHPRPTRV